MQVSSRESNCFGHHHKYEHGRSIPMQERQRSERTKILIECYSRDGLLGAHGSMTSNYRDTQKLFKSIKDTFWH